MNSDEVFNAGITTVWKQETSMKLLTAAWKYGVPWNNKRYPWNYLPQSQSMIYPWNYQSLKSSDFHGIKREIAVLTEVWKQEWRAVRNGCFAERAKIRFSVMVQSTSSSWMMTSFLRTLMAKICPVIFCSAINTYKRYKENIKSIAILSYSIDEPSLHNVTEKLILLTL